MILRHTAAGSIVFLDRASLSAISMSELWERFVAGYQEHFMDPQIRPRHWNRARLRWAY